MQKKLFQIVLILIIEDGIEEEERTEVDVKTLRKLEKKNRISDYLLYSLIDLFRDLIQIPIKFLDMSSIQIQNKISEERVLPSKSQSDELDNNLQNYIELFNKFKLKAKFLTKILILKA